MRLDNWIAEKIKADGALSRKELEDYQLKTLNELIKYVKENSSFYRELYKDLEGINSLDELYKIPIINSQDIIERDRKSVV